MPFGICIDKALNYHPCEYGDGLSDNNIEKIGGETEDLHFFHKKCLFFFTKEIIQTRRTHATINFMQM